MGGAGSAESRTEKQRGWQEVEVHEQCGDGHGDRGHDDGQQSVAAGSEETEQSPPEHEDGCVHDDADRRRQRGRSRPHGLPANVGECLERIAKLPPEEEESPSGSRSRREAGDDSVNETHVDGNRGVWDTRAESGTSGDDRRWRDELKAGGVTRTVRTSLVCIRMRSDRGSARATPPFVEATGATVLIVEDRRAVREVVMRAFAEQGYSLTIATTGPDAVEAALSSEVHLMVLDLGLPGLDGLDVIRTLREQHFTAPILALTARGTVDDRIAGLDAGADDYLSKPFDVDELLARVRALLRRGRQAERLTVFDLECDPLAREVRRRGKLLVLTQREYALLEYLMRNAGTPVTREMIAREVWKMEFEPENNIIDVYVSYLRQKLASHGGSQLLHTIRGTGYVLEDREAPSRQAGNSRSGMRSTKGR